MKKIGLVLFMLLVACTTAFAADVTWALDENITVSGTALENEQYEVVVTENGEERSVILDGVTDIMRVDYEDGYYTDFIRIIRDVTLPGKDDSYSQDFTDQTAEMIGQLDLETMTVVAEPVYFFDRYEGYYDFEYAIVAVDSTQIGYYKGQQWPLDGKFGVIDRDFYVVVPLEYDSISWYDWSGVSAGSDIDCIQGTTDGQMDLISLASGNGLFGITQSYAAFATYNRFVVKKDGISHLVDYDLNIITGEYTHVLELDYGKWLVSTDPSQTAPVYDTVIDNDGNVIADFNWESSGIYSDWATSYIQTASESGIIHTVEMPIYGMEYALYQEEITRAGFCKLLQNFLAQKEVDSPYEDVPFTDIGSNDFAIRDCYSLGIVSGKSDTEFDPYAPITRQEAATMLLRLCDVLELDTANRNLETNFSDFNQVDFWAEDGVLAISALKNSNGEAIMGGTSEATFDPQGTYTLEQAITTLVRLVDVETA